MQGFSSVPKKRGQHGKQTVNRVLFIEMNAAKDETPKCFVVR